MSEDEDVERLLASVTPRVAPPELRERVLGRVADVLTATGVSPVQCPRHGQDARGTRQRRPDTVLAWAVAGLVLLGVGLNFAAVRIGDARLAAYKPPRPEPVSIDQLATALAQADPRAADVLVDRLVAARRSRRSPASEDTLRQYQEFLNKTLSLFKEPIHAACQENPEVDVHRRRGAGGDTTDCQRLFRLDHRRTA
jgi:hypothetical protein